jgi:multicomponent Na+:H+ antiporter subunit D
MIENFVLLPVIVQLFLGIILLMFWKKTRAQRLISALGSGLVLLLAIGLLTLVKKEGIQTIAVAGWKAPFGIVFVADLFSSSLVVLTSIAGLSVSLFSSAGISRSRMLFGYYPVMHFLLMGLNGAFLTGDIFNLYVWFEVIIISSFVLLTLGGRKEQIEGAVKYMAMNILASMIFLTGIAILYGLTGTLNMADLSLKIKEVDNKGLVDLTALFFIIGFGIKSAVFPLYFWLPSSYHTPPAAVAALFGGLLTKVGIYALFRVFTLIFIPDDFLKTLLIGMAVLTIMTGAFGALIKNNLRRMFSYLIVCHIGFMIAALGIFNEYVLMGALFYLFHDIMVKTNLFLITGVIRRMRGTMNMDRLGGLYAEYPKLTLLMALVLFSLVGIPPLSGFWPKIYLFKGAYIEQQWWYIGALVIGSFVTLFVIAKLWAQVFWKNKDPENSTPDLFATTPPTKQRLLIAPIVLLTVVTLYLGFGAESVFQITKQISREMLDTTPYIKAVLGR